MHDRNSIVFASKAAAKTALKAAVSAAKTVGKKALKTAEEGIKQGISEARKYGTEKGLHGIYSIAEKTINKGLPADPIHKVSPLHQ